MPRDKQGLLTRTLVMLVPLQVDQRTQHGPGILPTPAGHNPPYPKRGVYVHSFRSTVYLLGGVGLNVKRCDATPCGSRARGANEGQGKVHQQLPEHAQKMLLFRPRLLFLVATSDEQIGTCHKLEQVNIIILTIPYQIQVKLRRADSSPISLQFNLCHCSWEKAGRFE